jgi:hypothetical protein
MDNGFNPIPWLIVEGNILDIRQGNSHYIIRMVLYSSAWKDIVDT